MSDINILETAYEILQRKVINDNYPKYMSEVFSDNMEEKHSVKFILKELTEVIEWKQDKKIILVDEEEYYKHLLNEVYAFYFRAQTQKKNIDEMLNSQKFDFTWKFVTQYYFFYFISCALSRINNNFVIYLEDDLAKQISETLTVYAGEASKINGNATFFLKAEKYKKEEGKVKITLQQTRDQHKSSSKALTAFFKTHKGNCVKDNLGLELNLVSKIYELLNSNSFSFSGARKYNNYRFEHALNNSNQELISKDFYDNIDLMWDYLINIDICNIKIENSSQLLVCVSEYSYQLLDKIIEKVCN